MAMTSQRVEEHTSHAFFQWLSRSLADLDTRAVQCMAAYGVPTLRISLATIFIWFGLLKVCGRSPVVDLVARTVYWVQPAVFIPVLGWWEIFVGLGLLFNVALRLTLFLLWLQLAGTLLVFALRPDIAFQGGNPFLLTIHGEFVMKNLVLIASGLVIGGTVRR